MASGCWAMPPSGFGGPAQDNLMQYYQHPPQMYGAFGGFQDKPRWSGPKKRLNLVSMIVALVVPCSMFIAIFSILSFETHYRTQEVALFLVGLGLIVVAVLGYFAVNSMRHGGNGDPMGANWYIFTFFTGFLAWSMGVAAGSANFGRNMRPYYNVAAMNSYPAVDPTTMHGQQLMDAGRMTFKPGSQLDLRYSMGFRDVDFYCVAPVATRNSSDGTVKMQGNYDFWAVGLNCCSGESHDFHCGDFSNPRAHSGLRLMREELRPFFRLAVQQAEAAYNIQARHPVFLYWLVDPTLEMKAYEEEGYKYFTLGIFAHFSMQLFLVVAASMGFSKFADII